MTNIFINKANGTRATLGYLGVAFSLMLAQQVTAENVLKEVKTSTQADGKTAITLQFDEPVGEVKAFSTDNPARIAIDLPDTVNGLAQKKQMIGSGQAKSISAVEAGGRTRVLVELAKNSPYRTQSLGNVMVLTIDAKSAVQNAVEVSAIDFKRTENGAGRLVVKFNESGAKPNLKESGSEIVLDIGNARLPDDLRSQMDVAGYSTPVLNIDAREEKGRTRLLLNTKGASDVMAYQTGNEYVVEISPKSNKLAGVNGKAGIARTGAVSSGRSTAAYSGRPVTFNFQDVPVRTVLQLIAEESSLNIVAADTVTGNVTLRLVNVPWDQALEIVLRAKGLDQRRDGNVVWVGPQAEIASYEQAKDEARIGKEVRQETVTEYIAINYGNAEAIAKLLTENSKSGGGNSGGGGGGVSGSVGGISVSSSTGFLSPRGSVSYDSRTNTLLLIDIPRKITEIKKMILILDRPVEQVLIEARVVVAGDSFARELGAKFSIGSSSSDPANAGKTTGFETFLNTVSNPAGILNFTNSSLDIELQALEATGKGEVVSNPRVITSNQKEAVIKQGEEIGYVTTQASTVGSVPQATVEFKEVLLELKVTPTITQDGRVFMSIFVKKDEVKSFLTTPTGTIPQIAKREVSTQVLVENGQTVVIGGVYEFKNRDDVSKVPFLGDIPFFGTFFKQSKKDLQKAELLIFVTPRILKPVRPAESQMEPVERIQRSDRN